MINKELLIEHWEYQKRLILAYGIHSDESHSINKYCRKLFDRACELYGFNWASDNLKPISSEDLH